MAEWKVLKFISFSYSPELRAEIGKYAILHGTTAASVFFSRKLARKVSETSIHSIKKAYLERLQQKRKDDSDDELSSLPPQKRGRPTLLGMYEKQLELYLKKIRQQGGIITASVVVAAARGILLSSDRSQLYEFGGHISLTRQWAYHLLG